MPSLYIADGHHRSAAAALVGAEKAKQNPNHPGTEEYNYFMAVCFQASQLTILGYNRVVKDLNGLSSEEFLARLSEHFDVKDQGTEAHRPQHLHEFSLYLDGHGYSLTAHAGTFDDSDPIGVLDVDISSRPIVDDILGIKDLRSDKRIDFVGGLRGLEELKRRVDSGEMRMALALYPVTMNQIMSIADSGKIMPPRSEEHTSELQSRQYLVCRLLLEKKNKHYFSSSLLSRLSLPTPRLSILLPNSFYRFSLTSPVYSPSLSLPTYHTSPLLTSTPSTP